MSVISVIFSFSWCSFLDLFFPAWISETVCINARLLHLSSAPSACTFFWNWFKNRPTIQKSLQYFVSFMFIKPQQDNWATALDLSSSVLAYSQRKLMFHTTTWQPAYRNTHSSLCGDSCYQCVCSVLCMSVFYIRLGVFKGDSVCTGQCEEKFCQTHIRHPVEIVYEFPLNITESSSCTRCPSLIRANSNSWQLRSGCVLVPSAGGSTSTFYWSQSTNN